MSAKLDLPYNLASEQIKLNELYLQQDGTSGALTTTGQETFVSNSSGVPYYTASSSNGSYSNLGQYGMLQILQGVLADYLITAEDFNAKLDQNGSSNYGVDTTNTNTYVVTLSPAPLLLTTGMVINFLVTNANTGACTLNANALGAKTLVKNGNAPLTAGDISAGMMVKAIYDGTNYQIIPSSVAGWSSGTNWEKTPTGKITQWGVVQIQVNGLVTFPVAFTNASTIIVQLTNRAGSPSIYPFSHGVPSLTAFNPYCTGSGQVTLEWFAVGY